MTFETVPGSEKEAFEARKAREEYLMQIGVAGRTIYLNGGSQTRRDIIEYWQDYARSRNIGFQNFGNCMLVVGGR